MSLIEKYEFGDYALLTLSKETSSDEFMGYVHDNMSMWAENDVVIDINRVSFDYFTNRQAAQWAKKLIPKSEIRAGRKTAFFTKSKLTFGMMRVFISHVDGICPVTLSVFDDFDKAQRWCLERMSH